MAPKKRDSLTKESGIGPFVKWAGGKASLLQDIREIAQTQSWKRYHEPFLGGGAIYFGLKPATASLSDTNPDLINAYTEVRDHAADLVERLEFYRANHSREFYLATRKEVPSDRTERAVRFLYLNRTCFNGLWRVNSRGEFNVPMGSYKTAPHFPTDRIIADSRQLKDVVLECQDFRSSLLRSAHRPKKGDLVYLDPPYVPVSATSRFTSYTKEDFLDKDQRDLADIVRRLTKTGVKVILSNSDTKVVRELYPNDEYESRIVSMSRAINSVPSRRGKIPERLIWNF